LVPRKQPVKYGLSGINRADHDLFGVNQGRHASQQTRDA
jgi:hypothetical protein